jgi:uncharacterized protein (UPF0335 family)
MPEEFDPMEIASASTSDEAPRPNNETGKELLSFIERIERLEEEKRTIADDIKDVKGEAKGRGYDMTTLNEMLKLRKLDAQEREEREQLRDTYGHAIGIFG